MMGAYQILQYDTYSQSNDWNFWELFFQNTQILVIRPEVMTPLTTAMSLLYA